MASSFAVRARRRGPPINQMQHVPSVGRSDPYSLLRTEYAVANGVRARLVKSMHASADQDSKRQIFLVRA